MSNQPPNCYGNNNQSDRKDSPNLSKTIFSYMFLVIGIAASVFCGLWSLFLGEGLDSCGLPGGYSCEYLSNYFGKMILILFVMFVLGVGMSIFSKVRKKYNWLCFWALFPLIGAITWYTMLKAIYK